jgi:hypothetical protein
LEEQYDLQINAGSNNSTNVTNNKKELNNQPSSLSEEVKARSSTSMMSNNIICSNFFNCNCPHFVLDLAYCCEAANGFKAQPNDK